MRANVRITLIEPMGSKGDYYKIWGVTDDASRPQMALCIAHRTSFPTVKLGKSYPSVTYYGKQGLSFEPLCDICEYSPEGGENK